MTSFAKSKAADAVEYPSSDGKPMAETEIHLNNMLDLIASLRAYYLNVADTYVAGNMLMYYVPLNKRKHVSPDIFVVRGIDKHVRPYYLVWQEGKGPDLVIELTSASTKSEDQDKKFKLYRDILKVSEYFLFDPQAEYLAPPLQGYRLVRGRYVRIRPLKGRLPSKLLGLHLESNGAALRLFDPECGEWLRTPAESEADRQTEVLARQQAQADRDNEVLARQQAEADKDNEVLARQQAEADKDNETLARQKAEEERNKAALAREQAEAELEKLRHELQALKERGEQA